MDSAVKAIFSVFFTCLAVILLVNVSNFAINYANAKDELYSLTQQVEIYGKDSLETKNYIENNQLDAQIKETYSDAGKQFEITIKFPFRIAIINLDNVFNLTCKSRITEI